MKKQYERASLTAVAFDAKDIITTSGNGGVITLPEDDLTQRAIFG